METPYSIIEKLWSPLHSSARYADLIQHKIEELEEKGGAANIFAAALSDADLSIQNCIEIAILSHFPYIPFYGEEWKSSPNTKYMASTTFMDDSPYVITLDPIDGTRLYLDGHSRYQIILSVVSRSGFESAIVVYPKFKEYVYAMKNRGAFKGNFGVPLGEAEKWEMGDNPSRGYLAGELASHLKEMQQMFAEVDCSAFYSKDREIHYLSSAVQNEIQAGILSSAQIIDGAALAFVAKEMGYCVKTIEGGPFPEKINAPETNYPGLIVARDSEMVAQLIEMLSRR